MDVHPEISLSQAWPGRWVRRACSSCGKEIMASDSEDVSVVETSLEIPEFDTQFIPQEDDDDTLWEVIEILAERGNRYKVKWAGDDPQTGKPWAPSWVAKHDCTDKLIHEWKLKQAKKKKKKDSPKKDSELVFSFFSVTISHIS